MHGYHVYKDISELAMPCSSVYVDICEDRYAVSPEYSPDLDGYEAPSVVSKQQGASMYSFISSLIRS